MEPYRYCISLRISHPSIDPEEISSFLGLDPILKWKVGDKRVSPTGRTLSGLRSESFWVYEPHGDSKISSNTQYIEDYLIILTTQLSQHKAFLTYIAESGGSIEYFIGIFSEYSIGSTFSAKLLKQISDLNIDLSFDIYAYPE